MGFGEIQFNSILYRPPRKGTLLNVNGHLVRYPKRVYVSRNEDQLFLIVWGARDFQEDVHALHRNAERIVQRIVQLFGSFQFRACDVCGRSWYLRYEFPKPNNLLALAKILGIKRKQATDNPNINGTRVLDRSQYHIPPFRIVERCWVQLLVNGNVAERFICKPLVPVCFVDWNQFLGLLWYWSTVACH